MSTVLWSRGTAFAAVLVFVLAACGGPAPETEAPAEPAPDESAAAPVEAAPSEAVAAESARPTATLYRDTWGVPHIYSDSVEAGMYALGYAQAEDRLSDIYIALRTGMGRMAEAFGESHVQQDYYMLMAKNIELSQKAWDESSPELRAIGENFVAGIDAYIAENPDEVYEHALDIEPWMLGTIGRAMILRWPMGEIMGDLRAKDRRDGPPMGSNQWAVAAERSADNVAILLTDPHLTWEGIAVFYECRVHAGDLEMNGWAMIGSPIIGFGHGKGVAWAPTTGGPDTGDVFEMKIRRAGLLPEYEYDGEWRKPEIKMISIPVKDGETVNRPAAYTHLGPVIEEPDYEKGVTYVGATPYFESYKLFEQSYKMVMARNNAEFYDAIAMNELMEQNMMFADTAGDIGYVRVGRTPIRAEGYDWGKPVPGWTSETAWQGIHPLEDHVQLMNPAAGYMQNCNISPANMLVDSPLTEDKFIKYLYNVSWDVNNPRGKRAVELLHNDDSITEDEAIAYALNIFDIMAEPWQNALKAAVDAHGAEHMKDADFAAAIEGILAWQREFKPEETATVVYKFWRLSATKEIDVKAIGAGEAISAEDQKKMLDLLAGAVAEVKTKFGKWNPQWGEVHVNGRGGKYFPVGGADFGANSDGPNFSETLFDVRGKEMDDGSGRYIANNGSGALMLVFLDPDGIRSYTTTPWGQSGHEDSPHYVDQAEKLYAKPAVKPTWWSLDELKENIASEKVLTLP